LARRDIACFSDESVLNQISMSKTIENVAVNVVAIGQGDPQVDFSRD